MIRMKATALVCLGISILPAFRVFGQNTLQDTAFLAQARSQAVSLYDAAMNRQYMLYNGSEYNPFPEPYEGHHYFGSEYWEDGSVKYYGERYDAIPMQYDLLNDVLIIEHYDQNGYMAEVVLHSEKVDYFELLDHTFVRLSPDTAQVLGVRSGFYDLLYDGQHKILCKRRKMVKERIESGALRVSFLERENFYLVKDGRVFPLKNKGSVLKVLSDKRRALNQYVRSEVRDYRNKEKLFVDLVRYYDSLE